MSTETAREGPEIPVAPPEAVLPAVRAPADLAWTIVQMRAGERITVNEGLIAAYQAAGSVANIWDRRTTPRLFWDQAASAKC